MHPGRSISTALLVAVTTTAPALSAELTGMASLTGTCERIIMGGKDMSAHCDGKILQTTYDTGRTGFTVFVGQDGVAITMSGIEGAKPDENTQLQSLDRVILNLNIEGVAPTEETVDGGCGYSNPYLGPMTISCQAVDTKGGAYLLQFRTDGAEPQFIGLNDAPAAESTTGPRGLFEVGPWLGSKLEGDADGGCLMSMNINPKMTLMVYANGNEAFSISIFNQDWAFAPEDQIPGELLFDGTTYPLSSVEVRNEHVLTVHGGAEEDSYELLFKAASELVFRMEGQQVTARLKGSAAATEALWACVSS